MGGGGQFEAGDDRELGYEEGGRERGSSERGREMLACVRVNTRPEKADASANQQLVWDTSQCQRSGTPKGPCCSVHSPFGNYMQDKFGQWVSMSAEDEMMSGRVRSLNLQG